MADDAERVSSDELIRRAKESLAKPPERFDRTSTGEAGSDVEAGADAVMSRRPTDPELSRSYRTTWHGDDLVAPVPSEVLEPGTRRGRWWRSIAVLVVVMGLLVVGWLQSSRSERGDAGATTTSIGDILGESGGGVELSPAVPIDDSWRRHCAVNPSPTHVVSVWRANDVVLDGGQTDRMEWSEAEAIFMPLQPGVGDPARFQPCLTWMTAWFMNDAEWLYGLYYVAWETDIDPDDSGGIALFRGSHCCGVDSDFGTLPNSPSGEYESPWDAHGWNGARWFGDEEASPVGTVDIEGAGSYDGTGYWFEWRKRLDSGDGTDWILEPGQTIGDVSTLNWFLTNLWDDSHRRSYEHAVTMTLATG